MKTTFEYTAPRPLREEPVFLRAAEVPSELTSLTAGSRIFPAAPADGGILAILTAEEGETILLETGCEACGSCKADVNTETSTVSLTVNGNSFADYVYDPVFPKPHLGPIMDNSGNFFTRCDRMHKEHPHQRSLIIAIGDVNGIDCWNEPADCGFVRNEKIYDVVSNAAYAAFTAQNRWTDHDGNPLMTENTRYTVYNQQEDCRMLDLSITFTAEFGDAVFGATKEAGPLGLRLRDELRADIGGGTLCNSRGGVGENECWGKDAEWCDYHGVVNDIGEMGVTVFDNPSNERFPTAWHIRAYGLFAANNLYFKGGYTLKNGDSITYRYRILFRRKEMTPEELADRYESYISKSVEL